MSEYSDRIRAAEQEMLAAGLALHPATDETASGWVDLGDHITLDAMFRANKTVNPWTVAASVPGSNGSFSLRGHGDTLEAAIQGALNVKGRMHDLLVRSSAQLTAMLQIIGTTRVADLERQLREAKAAGLPLPNCHVCSEGFDVDPLPDCRSCRGTGIEQLSLYDLIGRVFVWAGWNALREEVIEGQQCYVTVVRHAKLSEPHDRSIAGRAIALLKLATRAVEP